MSQIVATADEVVPDGYITPPHVVWSGSVVAGDVITYGFASATPDAGVTALNFDAYIDEAITHNNLHASTPAWTATGFNTTWTSPGSYNVELRLHGGGGTSYHSHGTVHGYWAYLSTLAGGAYCTYGTEANPDATAWSVVSSTILDVVVDATCLALGQPQLAVFATTALIAIEGTVLRQPNCLTLPPPVAPLDLSLGILFNPTTRLQWFDAAYWHYF